MSDISKRLEEIKLNNDMTSFEKIKEVDNIIANISIEKNPLLWFEAKLIIITNYWSKGNLDRTLDNSFALLDKSMNINNKKYMGYSYFFIANVYFYLENYSTALEMYQKALFSVENTNCSVLECSILNNIGEVYKEITSYDKAIKYYQRSLKISNNINNLVYVGIANLNIAETYLKQKKYKDALNFVKKSELNFKNTNYKTGFGYTYSIYAQIFFMSHEYEEALTFFKKAIKNTDDSNFKHHRIKIGLLLLKTYRILSHHKEFLEESQNLMKLSEKVASNYFMGQTALEMSEYYEEINDYKNALKYHKLYNSKHVMSQKEILSDKINSIKKKLEMDQSNKEKQMYQQKNKELAILNEKLSKLTNEDALTGIANRRSFIKYLDKSIIESRKTQKALGLIILDIDKFKEFNDNYGHVAGDNVLIKISKILSNYFSESNTLAARYGGDEFVIILRNTNLDNAIKIALEIPKLFEKANIEHKYSNVSSHITVTGGLYCQIPDKNSNSEEFMHKADKNLYKAKKSGRNKIIWNK